MIVDDFVEKWPGLAQAFDGAFIVRVPWLLNFNRPPDLVMEKFVPVQNGGICWPDDIRLPYPKLLLCSTTRDRNAILVQTKDVDSESTEIWSTEFRESRMNPGRLITNVGWFEVDSNGQLYEGLPSDQTALTEIREWNNSVRDQYGLGPFKGYDEFMFEWAAEIGQKEVNHFLDNSSHITAVATLFSCKNIRASEIVPDVRLQRRRAQRGQRPLYRYHELRVTPLKAGQSRHRNGYHNGEEKRDKAVHVQRGHSKVYTHDRPLFGKYVGRYWWQPHLRGTAPCFVDKDYVLSLDEIEHTA